MDIRIAAEYHNLRVYEIKLTADYLAKVEEEKERTRAERERLREEEAARRDFEREKARLAKEQSHYASVLAKLQAAGGSQDKVDEVLARLGDIDQAMKAVVSREANIRAGYVYVISNLGAFGERMVEIGLTRRLESMDRVPELCDASVPFRFDVHALVFSDDAVTLETQLHQRLADRKVNRSTTPASSSTPPPPRCVTCSPMSPASTCWSTTRLRRLPSGAPATHWRPRPVIRPDQ